MDLFTYPQSPGYKARSTSQAAAQATQSRAPRLRQLCIDQLLLNGPLTSDEIADALRIDRLSIRPRLSELGRAGRVIDSGMRRKNASGKSAICWKLAA